MSTNRRIFVAAYLYHKLVIPDWDHADFCPPDGNLDGVRCALWNVSGWHRDCSPPAWSNRATEEQKREGWEMAVRIEKILCTVLDEAHKRQVDEVMETLSEGPEGFYRRPS